MRELLVRALARARDDEVRFVEALPPEARAEEGTHERWAAKDLVAHLAAAKLRLTEALVSDAPSLAHEEPEVYAAHAHDSWEQVEADGARAHDELAAAVEREPLDDRPWLGGRSLATTFAGYGIRHPLGHVAEFHRVRGEERAAARVDAVAAAILAMLPAEVAHPIE